MTSDLFITFGGGRRGFGLAAERLGGEVMRSAWDVDVLVLDARKASSLLGAKWKMHEQLFRDYPKGYGLWLWKSIILKSALSGEFGSYSRVLYLDAGSQFNLDNSVAADRFQHYLDLTDAHDGLSFTHRPGQFKIPDFSEKFWGNPVLHQEMQVAPEFLNQPQIQAGCLFLTSNSRPAIEQWYNWNTKNSYSYLIGDDVASSENQRFHHRYDQSILSPLWRKNDLHTLPDETWFGPKWDEEALQFPIWTIRNDSSISLPAPNNYLKIKHRAEILSSLVFDRLNK